MLGGGDAWHDAFGRLAQVTDDTVLEHLFFLFGTPGAHEGLGVDVGYATRPERQKRLLPHR